MTVLAQLHGLLSCAQEASADRALLLAHRVGARPYVAMWVFRGDEALWSLYQDGRLVASGDGDGVTHYAVLRRILRDAGVFRVAWAWLTDRGEKLGILGAVRTVMALEYRSDASQVVFEFLSTPEPGYAWFLRDVYGEAIASGREHTQRAAMGAAYKAAGVKP